ncbi:TIGR04222 domain-containing membrane protein [Streptomyces sp. SudanB25_2051]|uniref:TIGR04222 domain-containing membrane protein n=1 Tax=Streptomyces sp. SudanB25_2051 TaxID=3035275 RepID=UPI003F56498A
MVHTGVYLAAFVLVAGALVYRLAAAARVVAALRCDGEVRRDLSAEELAFLAGGPRRVATTVLFRMREEGRLSVAEDGTVTLHADAHAADARDGIEKALLQAAGVSRAERLGPLVARTATSGAVRSVGDRLRAEGLLVAASLRLRQRRARRLLWASAVPPAALALYEAAAGAPHRWWAGLALAAVAAVPAWIVRPVAAQVPYRVRAGLDALRAARRRPAPSRTAGDALTALAATPLGAVALDGLAASDEPALRALVTSEIWRAVPSPYGDGFATAPASWWAAPDDWGSAGDAGTCGGGGGGADGGGGGGGGGCGSP